VGWKRCVLLLDGIYQSRGLEPVAHGDATRGETSWRGASQPSSQPTLTAKAACRLSERARDDGDRHDSEHAAPRDSLTMPTSVGAGICGQGCRLRRRRRPRRGRWRRSANREALRRPRPALRRRLRSSTDPSCRPRRDAPSGRCLPRCDAAGRRRRRPASDSGTGLIRRRARCGPCVPGGTPPTSTKARRSGTSTARPPVPRPDLRPGRGGAGQ
jgi:hypothetical protein